MEVDVTRSEDFTVKSTTVNTLSPEMFISDDNIINTQDSVEMEMDQQLNDAVMIEAAKQDVLASVNDVDKEAQHIQERRRSERLKKDANLTTMEKIGRVAQKKNLEGNPQKSNCFSVLSANDITHITSEMGIVIENDDFDTCNLLNDLETARNDLYLKQLALNVIPQTESVEEHPAEDKNPELIWLDDESSESEDFILVESRKKKRQQKNCQDLSC